MEENLNYLPVSDKKDILPILNKISIFGALSDEQLNKIYKLLKTLSFKKDEFIFKQGESPSHIYIVETGEVKIVLNDQGSWLELTEMEVGDCFGETSVLGIQEHSASAVAVVDTELIVLPRSALLSIFESDKELFGILILNIARETSRRLHQADSSLLRYVFKKKN